MGERGPELLIPSTAGTVISNSALHNATTTGGESMASHHHNNSQVQNSSTGGNSESRVVIANTFNIQAMDLQSFTAPKSRAEIARALGMSLG